MGDNIKVVVKVRPLIKRELQDKLPCLWQVEDHSIYYNSNDGKSQRFTFDRVYDKNTEICKVYNDIAKPIVESATAGINGTIFAYGQTSSGKTFTMMGEEKAPGIIPQAIYNIFENIQNNPDRDFLLRVSYIEIYNEKIKDLLDVEKKDIKICETPQGIKVEASEVVTNSPEQVLEIMNKGVLNRQIGSTNMNEQSSRSHTIFQIIIESKHHAEEDEEDVGCVNVSQLNLVDLAGSERSGQTGATGQRFKEGTHINKSLLSLGLVIKQLSEDPHKFVNYRDSKLTRILQNSLGGNAKTSIICAVTPAALDETISTLQFANRAKAVKNAPKVNAIATEATMLAPLMKKLAQLQYELETKKHLEEDNKQLTQKIRSLQKQIVHGEMVPQGWQASVNRRQTWCAPRRLTIGAMPSTAGLMGPPKSHLTTLPAFVTPSVPRRNNETTRKLSVQPEDDQSFVITEDFKKEEMTPKPTPMRKPKLKHMRKSVKFSDEVINLESEEVSISDTSTCSPDHKCYSTSRTPPCKLRSRVKSAEKELSELIELTSLEKMYPPTEVELIHQARRLAAKVLELECDTEIWKKKMQERESQIVLLKEQIDDSQKEKKEAVLDLIQAQEQCASLNEKLNDLENLKVKAKNREMELLSQLEEKIGNNPALSAGDCKNDVRQASMLSQFLDISKDMSLVNNSDVDQSVVSEHSKPNNFQNIQITNLEMQLDEKIKTIAELNEKLSNNKKIMTTLRKECLEKTDKLELLIEKLSAETVAKVKMSKENSELHNKISSLAAQLENASKDVQCYSELVLDMQQAASRSDTSSANPNITKNETIRVQQRLMKNNEELQASIESFRTKLIQKDMEIKEKDETIERISARVDEYAELLEQKNQDVIDIENERVQLHDQISDQLKVAYNLEVNMFEMRQDMKMLADEKETLFQERAKLSMELKAVVAECILYREKIEAIELSVSEKEVLISKLTEEVSCLKDELIRTERKFKGYDLNMDDFNKRTSINNNQDKVACCDGSCESRISEIKDVCSKSEYNLRREIEKLSNQHSASQVQATSCDCIKADLQTKNELMETKKILETTNTEMKKLQAEVTNTIGSVAKQESTIQQLEQECLCKEQEIEKLTKMNTQLNNNIAVMDADLKNTKEDLIDNRRLTENLEESLSGMEDATRKQIDANKNIHEIQLSKSEEVNHNLNLELSKKQDTLKLNSVRIHRLEEELKETVDSLEKCKLELGQYLQKCEECVAEINRLNSILSDMRNVKSESDQRALQEALQQSENYKIEVDLQSSKANKLASKLCEKEAMLRQRDDECKEALNKIEKYNADVQEFNLIIEEHKERINGLEISLTKVNIKDNDFQKTLDINTDQSVAVDRLKDEIRGLGEKLLEKEASIKVKDNEISEALEKAEYCDLIVKKLKEDLDKLNDKLQEKEAYISKMSSEILENEKLEVIVSAANDKVFEIEKTLTETSNREKQLQNALEKYKINNEEIARMHGVIEDLTAKLTERETIASVNDDGKLQEIIDNCKKFELVIESLKTELESKSVELAQKETDSTELRGIIDKLEQENTKLKEALSLKTVELQEIESALKESNKKDKHLRNALDKCNECASEINYLKTVLRETAVKLSSQEVELVEGDKLLEVQQAIEKCTKCDSEIEHLNAKLDELTNKLTEKKVILIKISEEDDSLQESLLELKKCDVDADKFNIIVDEQTTQLSDGATSAWTENVEKQLLSALEKCMKYEVDIDNLNIIISDMREKLAIQGERKPDLAQDSSESNFEIDNEKEESISSDTEQITESLHGEYVKQYELHINEYKSQVEELQLSNSDMAALVDLLTNENLMMESKFEMIQSENDGLRTNNKYLAEVNEELTSEISEAEEQVVFLMESIKQLQARIVWHRMNVSTLTATSNTENKLLRSKLISTQHHHNRLHTLCQREVAEMKQQLENLHVLMQSEMSYYQSPYKQAFSKVHKQDLGRNYLSTPTNASLNVTQSEYASFIDNASFTSDMLMFQTNMSINVDESCEKVAHNDNTLIESIVKPKSYVNACCQTESPKMKDCRKKLEYCTPDKTDATCQTVTDDLYEKLQKECTEVQQKCEVLSQNNEKMILSLKQAKKEKDDIQEENDSLSNDIMDRLTELDSLKEEIVQYKKDISVFKNKEITGDGVASKRISTTGTQTTLDLPLYAYDQGDYTALKHEVCALKLELTEVLNARDILLVKLEQSNDLENKNAPILNTSSEEYSSSEKPTHVLTNRISKIKCELDASKEECCKITNELATMKSYIRDSEETSKKMCQELENSFKIVNLQDNLDIEVEVSGGDHKCLNNLNDSIVKDSGSAKDKRNYDQLLEQNFILQSTVQDLRTDLTKSIEQCDNLSEERMEIKKLCMGYIAKVCDNNKLANTNMNTVEIVNSLVNNMDAKYKNEAENLHIQFNTLREEKFKVEKKITELTRDNEKFNLALMEKTDQCSKLTTNVNDLRTRLNVLQSEIDLKQKTEIEIRNKCSQYIFQFVERESLNSTLNNLELIDMLATSVYNRCTSEGKIIISQREHQLNEVSNKYKLLSDELEAVKQKHDYLEKHNTELKEINKAVALDIVRYNEEIDGQCGARNKLELEYQTIAKAYEEVKNELKTEQVNLSDMMEENKRITEENIKLNNEISILQSNLIDSKKSVAALTSSLTSARNDSNNVKEHNIQDLNALQLQIKDLEIEMTNLKNLNNILCDQNKKTVNQLNACESEMLKNQKNMATMAEEISHLKGLLEEKTTEITHQLNINSQLRLDCLHQLNEVSNKYKLLSDELEAVKQKHDYLEKHNTELKEMNKAVTLDIVQYKEQIDGQCGARNKLELEYQTIAKAYEEVKNELKMEKITLSEMMEENKRITEENVKLNNEISILKSNLIDSKKSVAALTSSLTKARNDSNNVKEHHIQDLNALQLQIKDLEREMTNLKNLNNILCDQNKKTADQLNACESEMLKNQKNMATMAEEISHLKGLLEEKTTEITHQLNINSQLRLDSKQKSDEATLSEELKKKCMEVEAMTINNSTLSKSNNILTSIMNRLNAETELLKLQLSEQSQKYEDDTNKYKKELKKLQDQLDINNLEVKHGGHPNLDIVEPKVAARKKRQSWHDQSRLSNECPQLPVSKDSDMQTIEELRSENQKLNADIAKLRDKAVQLEKLEFDLETSKEAMGHEFYKQSEELIPKARIRDYTQRTRRQSLHDQSRLVLIDVRSVGTNTIQGFDSDLLSMVVDRMTYEAQLEKNKTLQQQVENLRERNRQLSAELRGLTNAASVSMDAEQTQHSLERLRRENEELQVRLKEVDEECEICAQYLRQKEKDYDNLREIKIGLEKRVAELEGKAEKEPRSLILTTRKRRQSIHDQSRTQIGATTDMSSDGADKLRSELAKKQHEVQNMKEMIVDLRNQIEMMQIDKNTSGGENVARAGSAIVQNQKISDYIAEICRLRRVNAKLVNLCKKRDKNIDSDGNIIKTDT